MWVSWCSAPRSTWWLIWETASNNDTISDLIRSITNKLNKAVGQIPQGSAANKLHTSPHRKTNDVAEAPEGEF